MLQGYLGSTEAIHDSRFSLYPNANGSPGSVRSKRSSTHGSVELQRKLFKHSKQSQMDQLRVLQIQTESIQVNISGKVYNLSSKNLAKYPNSLLSSPKRRESFFDSKKQEYFFDQNRTVAECIHQFYQNGGVLFRPENFPEQLLVDELEFFGIYDYLDPWDKDMLILPEAKCTEVTPPSNRIQRFIWEIFERSDSSIYARAFNIFVLIVIVFSTSLLCLGTVEFNSDQVNKPKNGTNSSGKSYQTWENSEKWISIAEATCIGFFTFEILTRIAVSPQRLKFFSNCINIIDLVAIFPFYFTLFLDERSIATPLSILRVLRFSKIFRVLKISRYNSSMVVIGKAIQAGKRDLLMLASLLLVSCLLFASFGFYLEEYFTPGTEFHSIPHAMWWSFVTMLGIGYGDIVPKSIAGKVAGAMCALSGVIIVAPILPIIFDRWSRYNRLDQEAKLLDRCRQMLGSSDTSNQRNVNIENDIQHLKLIRAQIGRRRSRTVPFYNN